jgi:hypothetical protein
MAYANGGYTQTQPYQNGQNNGNGQQQPYYPPKTKFQQTRAKLKHPPHLVGAFLMSLGLAYCLLKVLAIGSVPYFKLFSSFGLVVYLLTQGAQLMWILILMDRNAEYGAYTQAQQAIANAPQAGNTPSAQMAQALHERLVQMPYQFKLYAAWIGLAAYLEEAIVNSFAFPFVTNWDAFRIGQVTGKPAGWDWVAFGRYIFSMFSVEAVAVVLIVVILWIYANKAGKAAIDAQNGVVIP